jgi:ABC-type phosphate transport system substrate-binding protein
MIKPRPIILFVVALGLVAVPVTRVRADGFALIGNAKLAVRALSHAEIKALYTGKSKTLGGSAAIVVTRPEQDATFAQFVESAFGIPTKTLLSKIQQEVFKGEMTKPQRANSDDEVIQYVGGAPGMIGVVSTQAASHLPSTVAVIAIGG